MWLKKSTGVTFRIGPIIDTANAGDATPVTLGDITLTKNGTSAVLAAGTLTSIGDGHYDLTLTTDHTDTLGVLQINCTKAARRMVPVNCMVLPATTYDALFANAAGAANGLFIAGTNAATTITSSTGSALTLSSTGSNGHALSATGNGTGNGFYLKGGATGDGLHTEGGATSGEGIDALADGSGCGVKLTGKLTGDGLCATGGATGRGIAGIGVSNDGIVGTATTSGHGIRGIGVGTAAKHGIVGTGSNVNNAAGIAALGGGTDTTYGLYVKGGTTAGDAVRIETINGHGIKIAPVGDGKHGILANAGSGDGKGFEVGSLGTQFLAGINQEVVDGLTVDQLTNSKATVGTDPTLAQAVYAIHQFLVASSISGTTVTVKDNAGNPWETFTINSSTAPTSITRAT